MQPWDWVVLGALLLLALGLAWALRALRRARAKVADLEESVRRTDARQDRLQRMVLDRGWRDSLDLTRFNWQKPDPF